MTETEVFQHIPALAQVPVADLQWLLERGSCAHLKPGEFLFKPGEPIDHLHVIFEGELALKVSRNGQFREVGRLTENQISGYLPYSRAQDATGYGEALKPVSYFTISKDHFPEMIKEHHELTTALVHEMSNRIKTFTKSQQQNDKMMALGKLSAGLAHELNNPSSAVVRSAQSLSKHLRAIPEGFKNVIKIRMTDEQVDAVNDMLFDKLDQEPAELKMMERSELVDDLMDWLDDHEVDDSEEVAENLVDFGFTAENLEVIEENVAKKDISPVLHWVNNVLTTERIVDEIAEASQRINDLVSSVKSYTHMDQAQEKQLTNIHKGLDNTLTMLNHKLKKSNITVEKLYDEALPNVEVFPSELNQVWTNIIDNAIDAMADAKNPTLILKTYADKDFAILEIKDNGTGIPEEIVDKIFDPFFTTKEIGKGTGLGLELVHQIITKQHSGRVYVKSAPGATCFKVCLPLS